MGALLDFMRPLERQAKLVADVIRTERHWVTRYVRSLAREARAQGQEEVATMLEMVGDVIAQGRHRPKAGK